MPGIALALSVNHFISSVGADAGFASIIGLAVLALLYFAHARESTGLRERAAVLEARVQQLEGRLTALARSAPATPGSAGSAPGAAAGAPFLAPARSGAPAVLPRPVTPSGAPFTDEYEAGDVEAIDQRDRSVLPPLPAAPAGSAGPALAAATRVLPAPVPVGTGSTGAEPPGAPPSGTPGERPLPGRAVTAAGANGSRTAPRASALAPSVGEGPPPVPAGPSELDRAGSAAGAGERPSRAIGGSSSPPPRSGAVPSSRRPVARPRPPRSTLPPAPARSGAPLVRRLLGAGVALALLAGIVIALVSITSGGGSGPSGAPAARTSNAPAPARQSVTTISPATLTVSVLNGTSSAGLAHRVSVLLAGKGYRPGAVVTAPDQTRTATVVAYTGANRAAALQVARALKLGPASVQPADPATRAVACPPPAPCSSQVIVTAGADLAATP